MDLLDSYIKEIFGVAWQQEPVPNALLDQLPYYLRGAYQLQQARFLNKEIVLAVHDSNQNYTTGQLVKHWELLQRTFQGKVVLVLEHASSLERKRLIEKGVNFIVPGKQLFLPYILMDLRESGTNNRQKPPGEKLIPSAQLILLHTILNRYEKLDKYSFKQLAEKFGYTQMAITKAAENLISHELCTIKGTKEKSLHFDRPIPELWHDASPLLVSPVAKTVYVDALPGEVFLMNSHTSALASYTDMVPSRQSYYAIEKNEFYSLQKSGAWMNLNNDEGNYGLEVWKYDPAKLYGPETEEGCVDPLSLYLSLKDVQDERIEMALEQIIEKIIW